MWLSSESFFVFCFFFSLLLLFPNFASLSVCPPIRGPCVLLQSGSKSYSVMWLLCCCSWRSLLASNSWDRARFCFAAHSFFSFSSSEDCVWVWERVRERERERTRSWKMDRQTYRCADRQTDGLWNEHLSEKLSLFCLFLSSIARTWAAAQRMDIVRAASKTHGHIRTLTYRHSHSIVGGCPSVCPWICGFVRRICIVCPITRPLYTYWQ